MATSVESVQRQETPLVNQLPAFGSVAYKQAFRESVSARIDGKWYALLNLVVLLSILVALAVAIPKYQNYFFFLLPAYFVFCNFLEYLLHKYPMHRKIKGFGVVYEHVTIHHNFYANESFYFEEARDYYAAILPYYIFIGLTATILVGSGVVYILSDLSNALFFALVAYGYYLMYELLHFSYHANESSFVKSFRLINWLAKQHIEHHQTKLMAHYNFNITFPLFDLVFGTLHKRFREYNSSKVL